MECHHVTKHVNVVTHREVPFWDITEENSIGQGNNGCRGVFWGRHANHAKFNSYKCQELGDKEYEFQENLHTTSWPETRIHGVDDENSLTIKGNFDEVMLEGGWIMMS